MRMHPKGQSRFRAAWTIKLAFVSAAVFTTASCHATASSCTQKVKEASSRVTSIQLTKKVDIKLQGPATALAWSHHSNSIASVSNFGNRLSVFNKAGLLIATGQRSGLNLDDTIRFVKEPADVVFWSSSDNLGKDDLCIWKLGRKDNQKYRCLHVVGRFDVSEDGSKLVVLESYPNVMHIFELTDSGHSSSTAISESAASVRLLTDTFRAIIGTWDGSVYAFNARGSDSYKLASPFYQRLPQGGFIRGSVTTLAINDCTDDVFVGTQSISPVLDFSNPKNFDELAAQTAANSRSKAQVISKSGGTPTSFQSASLSAVGAGSWDPLNRFVAFTDRSLGLVVWYYPSKRVLVTPTEVFARSLSISPDGENLAVPTATGFAIYAISSKGDE